MGSVSMHINRVYAVKAAENPLALPYNSKDFPEDLTLKVGSYLHMSYLRRVPCKQIRNKISQQHLAALEEILKKPFSVTRDFLGLVQVITDLGNKIIKLKNPMLNYRIKKLKNNERLNPVGLYLQLKKIHDDKNLNYFLRSTLSQWEHRDPELVSSDQPNFLSTFDI